MNVEPSKKEYRDLLDILSIADWVLMAHNTGKGGRIEPYDKLTQKFYSLAKDMGYDGLVEHDARDGWYYLTRTFEDTSRSWEFIDNFAEDTFWDKLTHRMTERDMARQDEP